MNKQITDMSTLTVAESQILQGWAMEGWITLTPGHLGTACLQQRTGGTCDIPMLDVDDNEEALPVQYQETRLSMPELITKPPWLMLERQSRSLCAVHASNSII